MKLLRILEQVLTSNDKNVLNSSPKNENIERFHEVSNKIMGVLKNGKKIDKDQLHTEEIGGNMFSSTLVRKMTLTQHLGEYSGNNFKDFTRKIAEAFEKAGFTVERGYGVNEIKGYEVLDENKEVVGEIDFLEKGSVPDMGHTVIFKHKKIK